MSAIDKYRPSLTANQITYILSLAKLDMSQEAISIIKTLAPFEAKIANNAISPSFSTQPKLSLEESLGMDMSPSPINSSNIIDKVAYNLACYNKTLEGMVNCSLTEIEAAKEHMYVNDLMSPEEEADYERQVNSHPDSINNLDETNNNV